MAARTTVQTELVRSIVYNGMMRSWGPQAIADKLAREGLSRSIPVVQQHMRAIRDEMRARRLATMEDRVDHELEILEIVRQKAFDAFERSTHDEVVRERSVETEAAPALPQNAEGPNGDAQAGNDLNALLGRMGLAPGGPSKEVNKTKRKGQVGDPRHLDVVLKASDSIRKLLGVEPEAVKNININVHTDGVTITPDDVRKLGPAELARILSEAVQPPPDAK